MRSRLRISPTLRFAAVAFLCIAALGVSLAVKLRADIRAHELDHVTEAAQLVARMGVEPQLADLASTGPDGFAQRPALDRIALFASVQRLTVIAPDGRVLYASDQSRPETSTAALRERAAAGDASAAIHEDRDLAAPVAEAIVPVGSEHQALAVMDFDAAPMLAVVTEQTNALYLVLTLGLGLLYVALLPMMYVVVRRLRRTEEESRYTTDHDALTGLPNRQRFQDAVTATIGGPDAAGTFALMLLDLDRFRTINDTLGHDRGDRVIGEIAARLKRSLRETDLVARLGGDEFAVLLPGVPDADAALRAATKVRTGLEHPINMDGMNVDIAASIGIALSPTDGRDVTTLMQKADVALYQAKAGRGGARVYDSSADGNTPERLGMIAELRHAVEHDELVLFYQPKARLDDGSVEGVEALVRWRHPQRGLVPPGMFIPLAEETGLIKEITVWVVDQALRQARQWRTQGTALPISVNISAQNLHDPALTEDIACRLRHWEADADWIRLEITESAVMEDPEGAMRGLAELADMGLELAMDDYGTGYSALNYLKRLPLSELKIDRSFVANITADQTDALIIGSTIELGHSLGLRIVAEGVETESDWLGLQMLGCDTAQGFFLGRPMPSEEFDRWLTDSGRGYVDCVPTASSWSDS